MNSIPSQEITASLSGGVGRQLQAIVGRSNEPPDVRIDRAASHGVYL